MTDGTARGTVGRRVALGLLGSALLPGGRGWAADRASGADRGSLVTGNSGFGLDLYARLRTGDGNLFFSPYSISDALAMTYAGARGATADEMARALRFALPSARLHGAFADLIREINGAGKTRANELYTANALWSQNGAQFVADFQRIAKGSHGAALEEVDFKNAPETARRTINAGSRSRPRTRSRISCGKGW